MSAGRRVGRLGVLGLSLAAIGVAVACGAGVGGCGGNDDTSPPAPGDVGTGPDGSVLADGETPAAVTIDIQVPATTVYAGQKTQLVASQSKASNGAALSFGWTFTSVPPGSKITNASIEGINELISFVPDIAGDYVVTVTATAGETVAKKDVTVKAVNAPIFYVRTTAGTTVDDVGFEVHTVQMDGTGDHAVACRQHTLNTSFYGDAGASIDLGDGGADSGAPLGMLSFLLSSLFADQAIDWWEAPAGQASHAAFQNITFGGDAGPDAANNKVDLFVATQDNTCQMPPFPARTFMGRGDDAVMQPKFSPDGHRVAFVERRDGKMQVVTTAIDGSDARELGTYCLDDQTDCTTSANLVFPRRPQWLDETHLGWLRATSSQSDTGINWEIVVAPDIPAATVSRYMACTSGSMPTLFNFLRDGSIVADVRATRYGAEDLLVLGRDPAGTCTVVRNLTNFGIPGSYARDFALSPDGDSVAYIHKLAPEGSTGKPDSGASDFRQGGDLYIVPVDGSKPPAPLGTVVRRAEYGPRYIAGGTRVAWNGSAPPPPGYDAGDLFADAGDAAAAFLEAGLPAINVMQVDGGNFTPVALGDPNAGIYVLGGGNGGACSLECGGLGCAPTASCETVERKSPAGPAFWASAFGLIFLIRRRQRKNGSSQD